MQYNYKHASTRQRAKKVFDSMILEGYLVGCIYDLASRGEVQEFENLGYNITLSVITDLAKIAEVKLV